MTIERGTGAARRGLVFALAHPGRVGILIGAGIAALGITGSPLLGDPPEALDLDLEKGLPSAFSGALLLLAAMLAALLAREYPPADAGRVTAFALAAFLAFVAIDEILALHERPEEWTGVTWQVFYLPVFVAAAVIWGRAVRDLVSGHARILLAAGALLWLVAVLGLEEVDALWDIEATTLTSIEELVEMAGTGLIVVALLLALQVAPGGLKGIPPKQPPAHAAFAAKAAHLYTWHR